MDAKAAVMSACASWLCLEAEDRRRRVVDRDSDERPPDTDVRLPPIAAEATDPPAAVEEMLERSTLEEYSSARDATCDGCARTVMFLAMALHRNRRCASQRMTMASSRVSKRSSIVFAPFRTRHVFRFFRWYTPLIAPSSGSNVMIFPPPMARKRGCVAVPCVECRLFVTRRFSLLQVLREAAAVLVRREEGCDPTDKPDTTDARPACCFGV